MLFFMRIWDAPSRSSTAAQAEIGQQITPRPRLDFLAVKQYPVLLVSFAVVEFHGAALQRVFDIVDDGHVFDAVVSV